MTLDGVALCAAHRKRIIRGQRLTDPVRYRPRDLTPLERVIFAGSDFLEADSEDDAAYERTFERFRAACVAWMRSMGWTPPAALVDEPRVAEVENR